MAVGVRPEHRTREEGESRPAIAASWSTTRCRPMTRPSTPWASACSIAARLSVSWRRCGSRRASVRSTSPKSACRASRAPSMPRSSRCRASRCSRRAISPRRADRESLVLSDKRRGVYKRMVLENNKVCGAVLFGDVREASKLRDLIADRTDVGPIRDQLLFDNRRGLDARTRPAVYRSQAVRGPMSSAPTRTTCPYCGVGCGVLATPRKGRRRRSCAATPRIRPIAASSA